MGILEKFSKKKGAAPKGVKKADDAAKEKAAKAAPEAEKAETKKQGPGPLAKEMAGEAHRVLVRPVYSEKADGLQALGQYTFVVSPRATKVSVSDAVRDLYGVKPASVRIIVSKGKHVRFGRTSGRQKDVKKAVVTLPAGQTLTFSEAS
jgi:large subunit ribosomal protein L23